MDNSGQIRLPGSDSALAADEFDPGEIAGMRSAASILLMTSAVSVVVWLVTREGPPIAGVVDLFLGAQLMRLRHSWRAWAMLRAGAGLVFGLFILLGALASNVLVANLFALGNVAYCASLLLLLYGNPPARRVLAGRVAFGLSLVLICAALLLIISGIAPPLP